MKPTFLRLLLSCGCTIVGMYPRPIRCGERIVCLDGHGWQFVKGEPEPATLAEKEELMEVRNA